MCDVTISPKSWENCYATVQDYRRRFADPYYFEFGSGTQTMQLLAQKCPLASQHATTRNSDKINARKTSAFTYC